MKKNIAVFCLIFLSQVSFSQSNSALTTYAEESFYSGTGDLNFIRFKEGQRINQNEVVSFINSKIFENGVNVASVQKTEQDELGFTHIKLLIFQNGIELSGKVIMAHCSQGKLISLNGDLNKPALAINSYVLDESAALTKALNKVKAKKYKWENKAEERHMREALNEPNFSYYPHGHKVLLEKNGKYYSTYKFNIYAEAPLYRAHVFVDASTGVVLEEQNLICTADVPGLANTKFSGTQTITCDQNGSSYRLREVQRGLGIDTYNMQNTSTYSNTDFTNTATNWTTTGVDQAATDAHWGAEKTYDYYFTQHNRNSINNNGYKLLSYVHYQTNYSNAFWDGQRMTYGDGNGGSLKIFTALDVCGHEITHGLTSNTGNLTYSNESGALNESYSDIFGACIENYGRPSNWNWKVGEDITSNGNGLRSMSNPNAYGDPDTYGGTNYYTGTADNGGVHTNSGVSNFWFYLLTVGGSGTNDLSNAYSVTGIGITSAAKIAFRALTVYYTPGTNYANARNLSIQAARDLFGNCSNEVIQTTRAWYAVGVGANYVPGLVGPNFNSNITSFCSPPATVNFSNTTLSGLSYTWNFGDGATATSTNAVHTYTTSGVYSVKLKAVGCASSLDSVTKTAYIVVNAPVSNPSSVVGASVCGSNTLVLTAAGSSTIKWYDNQFGGTLMATGNSFTTPLLNSTTSYYAANTVTLAPFSGGLLTNTGGGYLNNNAQWLVFDVLQGGVLNSVVVYAQTAGSRIIQLRSPGNVILNTTTFALTAGANTLTLNYNLLPGTNYQLGLSSSSASGLYRTNSGVSYPYNIGGCVNITSSSAGAGAYYFFYNWKISKDECASSRIPVVAAINDLPQVSVTANSTLVCSSDEVVFDGSPVGGVLSGTALIGNVFAPQTFGVGVYTVSYTYTDMNGCSDKSEIEMTVQECTGLDNADLNASIRVYPNPAKEVLHVKTNAVNCKVVISDLTGRILLNKEVNSGEEVLKLEAFSKGVYLIDIKNQSGSSLRVMKFIKE